MSKLKYGPSPDVQLKKLSDATGFKASEVFVKKSGRFVVFDISDGYYIAAEDNETTITGYTPWDGTVATSGDKLPVFDVRGVRFELPFASAGAAATLTAAVGAALIGKKIDLYVASNIQYADNAANQAILEVVDYDVAENTLTVIVVESAIAGQS